MQLQTSARDQLRAFVTRIERLEEEKAALAADLREVYAEAKGNGFDVKTLRTVIRLRKQDENKRREEEAVLTTYLQGARHGGRRSGLAPHKVQRASGCFRRAVCAEASGLPSPHSLRTGF